MFSKGCSSLVNAEQVLPSTAASKGAESPKPAPVLTSALHVTCSYQFHLPRCVAMEMAGDQWRLHLDLLDWDSFLMFFGAATVEFYCILKRKLRLLLGHDAVKSSCWGWIHLQIHLAVQDVCRAARHQLPRLTCDRWGTQDLWDGSKLIVICNM